MKRLLKFNLFMILKSFFVVSIYVISILLFLITFYTLLFIELINEMIIVNILLVIFLNITIVAIIIFKIFNQNKYNYIDIKLIIKPYSKWILFLSRVFVILAIVMSFNLLITIFQIGMFAKLDGNFYLFFLTSNIFITPWIMLLIVSLLILISNFAKLSIYPLLSLLIIFAFSLSSFVSRPLLNSEDKALKYSNKSKRNFSKIINLNNKSTYIGVNNTKNELLTNVNDYNLVNNFLPSEWLLSYYYSFYLDLNNNKVENPKPFAFNNYKLSPIKTPEFKADQTIVIRPNDINFIELTSIEYVNLILENINKIDSKYSSFSFNDSIIVNNFLSRLEKNIIWTDAFYNEDLELLKSLVGIDTEFNQMFYIIKYYWAVKKNISILLDQIQNKYNLETRNLFNFLWTSYSTKFNLFISNNILNTNNDVNYYYPDAYVVNQNKPITYLDSKFLKEDFIRFDESNNAKYLNEFMKYSSTNILPNLSNIDPSIIDKASWIRYIDNISLSYEETNNFINKISNLFSDIYKFKLNSNYFSTDSFSYIAKYVRTTNIKHYEIFIAILSLITPIMFCWSYYSFKNLEYKR